MKGINHIEKKRTRHFHNFLLTYFQYLFVVDDVQYLFVVDDVKNPQQLRWVIFKEEDISLPCKIYFQVSLFLITNQMPYMFIQAKSWTQGFLCIDF